MSAVNAGSRDALETFGVARKVSRKSILSSFMEALRQSRHREARHILATYAHLVADLDTINNATSCGRTRRATRSTDKQMQ
jgi:hypothetical protein